MWDFLSFRRMLMPYLIQVFFWAGTVVCIFQGVLLLAGKQFVVPWSFGGEAVIGRSNSPYFLAFMFIVIGPLMLRLWCEVLIVIFRINETLTDMSGGGSKGKK